MVFGHPNTSWHKCGPRTCGILPMSTAMGPIETLNRVFWPKNIIFLPKYPKFGSKNEKYRFKTTPEVADGNHGDLGRGQEGKNCLEGEDILLNMSLLW